MISHAFLTLFFIISGRSFGLSDSQISEVHERKDLLPLIEEKLKEKVGDLTNSLTSYLEEFNDSHLATTALGRALHYHDIKSKFSKQSGRGRTKKMSMALMPLIFHVGATSTWMLLTTIMAAKSVAIGLALLVFKIAVSSAKVASFFTVLKGKTGDHHHHGWSEQHHGYDRRF